MGAGGTKLPRRRPCSSNCASHAQSARRSCGPGFLHMRRVHQQARDALLEDVVDRASSRRPRFPSRHGSRREQSSQSRSARRSAVAVPKVCTYCTRLPLASGTRKQAAIVALCREMRSPRAATRSTRIARVGASAVYLPRRASTHHTAVESGHRSSSHAGAGPSVVSWSNDTAFTKSPARGGSVRRESRS
jgi:hypothetical protein